MASRLMPKAGLISLMARVKSSMYTCTSINRKFAKIVSTFGDKWLQEPPNGSKYTCTLERERHRPVRGAIETTGYEPFERLDSHRSNATFRSCLVTPASGRPGTIQGPLADRGLTRDDARGKPTPGTDAARSHFETLIIYKLSSRKFTTQNDLYE